MFKPIIDIQLIKLVQDRLQADSTTALATTREELNQIYERLKVINCTEEDKITTERLLPEYMKSNPEILAIASDELVREVLKYVSNVCNYYQMIKTFRPLTNEEKDLGRKLSELLRGAQDLL